MVSWQDLFITRVSGGDRKGQVALIVILVVVIGLTVGVSVLSRSVTSVNISTEEEERARAFSAAEAGVEDALRQNLSAIGGGSFSLDSGAASTNYSVTRISNLTTTVDPGQVVTVTWAQSSGSTTSFSATWTGSGCAPQLISSEITSAGGATFNTYSTGPRTFNRIANGLTRLRFVGCPADVTLTGAGGQLSFYTVDSLGTSSQAESRVQVSQSAPAAVGIMDYAVFSGGNIQ